MKMELDPLVIWRRGNYTLNDLIGREVLGNYSFKNLVSNIPDNRNKVVAYIEISKILMEQEKRRNPKKQ